MIVFFSVSQLYPEKRCLIKYEIDINVYVLETHLGKNAKFSRNNKREKFCENKYGRESFFAQLIVAAAQLTVFAEFFFAKFCENNLQEILHRFRIFSLD